MERCRLGETGIEVSRLGLGAVKFGRNTGVKYSSHFDLPSDEDILQLLDVAEELGINYLDTAPAYGTSEERIGKLLSGDSPDRFMIFTKVGEWYKDGVSSFDFTEAAVLRSVDESRKRLQRDVLDVVLIHSDGVDENEEKFEEAFAALHELKSRGIIRAAGMSPKTAEGARLAVERCDVVMLTLNERERAMIPLIREAAEGGVGVIIKKGFASGRFGGDSHGGVGAEETVDPVARALGFIFDTPGVTTLVTGTLNVDHLRRSAEVVERIAPG